jgi:hypothetical protein
MNLLEELQEITTNTEISKVLILDRCTITYWGKKPLTKKSEELLKNINETTVEETENFEKITTLRYKNKDV